MAEDLEAILIAEQIKHTMDLLRAELASLRTEQAHTKQMADHRLKQLEETAKDVENRLRSLQESSTQFKVLAGLATGGGILSVVSLIRMIFGGAP